MKTLIYETVEETYPFGTKSRVSYGIAVYERSVNGPAVIQSIRDISPDKKKIDHLVSLCNRLELSAEHLGDVVEDFLAE